MRTITVCFALLSVCAYMLLIGIPAINSWEKAHAFPYGKMCHSVFTGYVDTCK